MWPHSGLKLGLGIQESWPYRWVVVRWVWPRSGLKLGLGIQESWPYRWVVALNVVTVALTAWCEGKHGVQHQSLCQQSVKRGRVSNGVQ